MLFIEATDVLTKESPCNISPSSQENNRNKVPFISKNAAFGTF